VNVRYINNSNEAVTRTLCVADTKCQHTSSELKVLLLKILEEFEIPLQNVLCCVTDNAANMIKIVKDFNIDLAAAESESATSAATDDQEPNISDEDEAGVYVLVNHKSVLKAELE
jgi:hypothetical protein